MATIEGLSKRINDLNATNQTMREELAKADARVAELEEAAISRNEKHNRMMVHVSELEAWVKSTAPLIQAVRLNPVPHQRDMALALWASMPIDPYR